MHQEALNLEGFRLEKPTCVIVVGMHRSGTSAITKALNLLGAGLPKEILGAGLSNVLGHWEPAQLVKLHEKMLEEFGSSWDDWRSLDLSHANPMRLIFYKDKIKELILEQFAGEKLFVLKDPRICRFLELYKQALDELSFETKIVFVHRNPLAVSASLYNRDQIVEEHACLLWLRHIVDAELSSQGLHRVFVSYETVLDDWHVGLSSLEEVLGIDFRDIPPHIQQSVSSHFSRDLQHHNPSIQDVVQNKNLLVWIKDAFIALSTNDEQVISNSLRTIRKSFEEISHYFARESKKDRDLLLQRVQMSENRLLESEKDRDLLLQRVQMSENRLLESEKDRDLLLQRVQMSENRLLESEKDRDLLLQRVQMSENRLLETVQELSAVNENVEYILGRYLDTMQCLESETSLKISKEQEIIAIRNSTSWRISYPIRALRMQWDALKKNVLNKSR